jgi:hypothetical protein
MQNILRDTHEQTNHPFSQDDGNPKRERVAEVGMGRRSQPIPTYRSEQRAQKKQQRSYRIAGR